MPALPITVRAPKGGGSGGGRGGSSSSGSGSGSGSKGSSGNSGGGSGSGSSSTKGGSSSGGDSTGSSTKTGSKSGWGSGSGSGSGSGAGSGGSGGGYRGSRPRPGYVAGGAGGGGGHQSGLKWWEILLIVWGVLFAVAFVASGIWYWRKERSRVRALREAEEDPSYDPTSALAPSPTSSSSGSKPQSADPRFRTQWVLLKALAFASGLALPIWAFRRWGHRCGCGCVSGRGWKGFKGLSGSRGRTKGMPYEKMAHHGHDHDHDDTDDSRYGHGHGDGPGRDQGYGDTKGNADAKYEPMGYNAPPPPPPAAAAAADYFKPPPPLA